MKYRKINNIFFVGIGGIGMSGIAELLNEQGFNVSGSDIYENENVKRLKEIGIKVTIGHDPKNISGIDLLVYSSAVPIENPEILMAKQKSIPVIRRAEMLGDLISLKETSIAVGGTHGKTTTSSIIGSMLAFANHDPTLIIGGLVKSINSNTKMGSGKVIIVEADEYDRSFLALKPTIAIITNIELEHTDCYKNIEDLKEAFIQFAKSIPFYGQLFICIDSPILDEISKQIERPIVTYGFSDNAQYQAKNLSYNENKSTYDVFYNRKKFGRFKINLPGDHNILNSLASLALCNEMRISHKEIKQGLSNYNGVRRRFEIKGTFNDIMVVDDYAHHPTEVTATLIAAKKGWKRRVIVAFQPHLYTRTLQFHKEFAKSLQIADLIIITDIYPAREKPIIGVSARLIFDHLKEAKKENCFFIPDLNDLERELDKIIKPNDLFITIGAGTIWRYNESYAQHLKQLYNYS